MKGKEGENFVLCESSQALRSTWPQHTFPGEISFHQILLLGKVTPGTFPSPRASCSSPSAVVSVHHGHRGSFSCCFLFLKGQPQVSSVSQTEQPKVLLAFLAGSGGGTPQSVQEAVAQSRWEGLLLLSSSSLSSPS